MKAGISPRHPWCLHEPKAMTELATRLKAYDRYGYKTARERKDWLSIDATLSVSSILGQVPVKHHEFVVSQGLPTTIMVKKRRELLKDQTRVWRHERLDTDCNGTHYLHRSDRDMVLFGLDKTTMRLFKGLTKISVK